MVGDFYALRDRVWSQVSQDRRRRGTALCPRLRRQESGDVYKAASWKAPAKGVRYNLVSKTTRDAQSTLRLVWRLPLQVKLRSMSIQSFFRSAYHSLTNQTLRQL